MVHYTNLQTFIFERDQSILQAVKQHQRKYLDLSPGKHSSPVSSVSDIRLPFAVAEHA